MKKILFSLSCLFTTVLLNSQTLGWNPLGPNDYNQATGVSITQSKTDFKLNAANVPYVAFADLTNDGRLSVRKHNGTTWEYVGGLGISTGSISAACIAFDNTGIPYVVYGSYGVNTLYVIKYNGTSWVSVGSVSMTGSGCTEPCIALDASNNVYVGYYDNNVSSMSVKKFDGTSWSYVGTQGFTPTGLNYTDIAIDASNTIYFKYGNKITKYNGVSWTPLPTVTSSFFLSMSLDNTGQPYVAFDSTSATNLTTVRCKFYNGSNWVNSASGIVYSLVTPSYNIGAIVMCFGKDNKPYVAFGETGGFGTPTKAPRLYVNNGPSWTAVTTNSIMPFKSLGNDRPYLLVDNSGKVFFGSAEEGNNKELILYTYSSNIWTVIGNKDITNGQLGIEFAMDISPAGEQYVVEAYGYGLSSSYGKLSVKKYNGIKWDSVGISDFNGGGSVSTKARFPKIKINSMGVPYVSYTTGNTTFSPDVKKFNGTSWVNVSATASITGNGDRVKDIDFLPNDTLIAATVNSVLNPFVTKFNGTNWVQLGSAITGTANVSTDYLDLEVDPFGTVYLAYSQINGTAQGLYVKKYTAGVWQTVGTGTISSLATDVTLKFSATGEPIVCFTRNNFLLNVMKYNGTNWVNIGISNFATIAATNSAKMEIDNSGNPIVVFASSAVYPDYNKITSMQFNGTSWVTIGGANHSLSKVVETALAKNPSTNKITEAFINTGQNGTIWVKELGTVTNVGIEEHNTSIEFKNEFICYPNPTSNYITIVRKESLNEAKLIITDIFGRTVYTESNINLQYVVNMTEFSSGIYIITLVCGNTINTQKLIKN